MKQFYLFLRNLFTFCAIIWLNTNGYGQSSTSPSMNGNCHDLVQNFNSSSGGHSSPSIYGGTFDSAMYYNHTLGYWTEMDGNRTIGPGVSRVVTIISPPYSNPSPPGIFDAGFWYKTSSAVADRFQVRIVAISPGPAGTTVTNTVASSGIQKFTDWSSPAAFIDQDGNTANNGDTGHICIRLNDVDITNGANTYYRVEIAYIENAAFFAAYDNLSIGPLTQQSPLPVNFIGIVGNRSNDYSVNIKWDVGEEINVGHYELERSTDGSSFTKAGSVNAIQKTVYSYTDEGAKEAILFYRVKSVDIDGQYRFSGIIKVNGNNSFSTNLHVYPLPASNMITVQHKQTGSNAHIILSTMDGKLLKTIVPAGGSSHTMIDISSFSSGMYILRMEDGKGKIESTTVVKQ